MMMIMVSMTMLMIRLMNWKMEMSMNVQKWKKMIILQLFSLFNPTKGCELEPLFGEIAKNIITIIITTKASLINIVIIISMIMMIFIRWMWGCGGSKWATQVLPAWHGTASNLSLIQIWIKILKRKKLPSRLSDAVVAAADADDNVNQWWHDVEHCSIGTTTKLSLIQI